MVLNFSQLLFLECLFSMVLVGKDMSKHDIQTLFLEWVLVGKAYVQTRYRVCA